MRYLRILIVILILFTWSVPPTYALAPQSGHVNLGPFELSLEEFKIVELLPPDQPGGIILKVEQLDTGDIWSLLFKEEFTLPRNLVGPVVPLPVPQKVGFDLLSIPKSDTGHSILNNLSPKEEQISWISIEGNPRRFLTYEWKTKIWKYNAANYSELTLYNGVLDQGDPKIYAPIVGKRKLFQKQKNGNPYLEGDGIWGLPVKRRLNGEEILLIYRKNPIKKSWIDESFPLPNELGVIVNGKLTFQNITHFSEIDERIKQLADEINQQGDKPSAYRQSLRRQLNRLRSINRNMVLKVQKLDALKKELVALVEIPPARVDGKERRSVVDRRDLVNRREKKDRRGQRGLRNLIGRVKTALTREKREDGDRRNNGTRPEFGRRQTRLRRQSDKEISSLAREIDSLQKELTLSMAKKVQNEIFEFELDEIRNGKIRNGALTVRNDDGDEIGYRVLGNQISPYPPIVVFPGWNGAKENSFLKQLKATNEGQTMLNMFRFLVVTLPEYPHFDGDEMHRDFVTTKYRSPNEYFSRAANAFDRILKEEGESRAFVLGTGIGAVVAGEVAQQHWVKIPGQEKEDLVEGIILFDPTMFNPLALSRRFTKGLKTIFIGFKQAQLLRKFISEDLKGKISVGRLGRLLGVKSDPLLRDQRLARARSYEALLSQTLTQTYYRFSALRNGPTLILARNSREGKAIKEKIAKDNDRAKPRDYYPGDPKPNMELVLYSLLTIIEENDLTRHLPNHTALSEPPSVPQKSRLSALKLPDAREIESSL